MKKTALFTLGVMLLGCCVARAQEDEKGEQAGNSARGIVVEEIRNTNPQFSVRVSVDREDRTYHEDESVVVTVESSRDGYLYLLYCDAADNVQAVFPNRHQQTNRIAARQKVVVPAKGSNFRFRVSPPFGTEVLKAIVTDRPVKAAGLSNLTKGDTTVLDAATLQAAFKGLTVEAVDTGSNGGERVDSDCVWAEHSVEIYTLPANAARTIRQPRRFAVLIGISSYASPKIRDLSVCHEDAKAMKSVLVEKCGVDNSDCWLLLNKQATMERVRELFCDVLPDRTRAGDVIFIYWSGHGGRCADEGGDEADGFDEYLPVYDSERFDMSTMLMDDTFGRWIQGLDGRKIVVVLDTCHSGGQANRAKGLQPPNAMEGTPFDFVGNEFSRVKDIGQDGTAIVASSVSDEVSHERTEGDLSVMTYFVVEELNQAAAPMTLDRLVEKVTPEVSDYIGKSFAGAKQSVFYQSDLAEPLELNLKVSQP